MSRTRNSNNSGSNAMNIFLFELLLLLVSYVFTHVRTCTICVLPTLTKRKRDACLPVKTGGFHRRLMCVGCSWKMNLLSANIKNAEWFEALISNIKKLCVFSMYRHQSSALNTTQ